MFILVPTPQSYPVMSGADVHFAVCDCVCRLINRILRADVDKPYIDNIEIGEDFVIVSWKPSSDPPSNPASEFTVEYRPEGLNCCFCWGCLTGRPHHAVCRSDHQIRPQISHFWLCRSATYHVITRWPVASPRARGTICRRHFVALTLLTLSNASWKRFYLPRLYRCFDFLAFEYLLGAFVVFRALTSP